MIINIVILLFVFQWNGPGANKDEKFRAADYLKQLRVSIAFIMSYL